MKYNSLPHRLRRSHLLQAVLFSFGLLLLPALTQAFNSEEAPANPETGELSPHANGFDRSVRLGAWDSDGDARPDSFDVNGDGAIDEVR